MVVFESKKVKKYQGCKSKIGKNNIKECKSKKVLKNINSVNLKRVKNTKGLNQKRLKNNRVVRSK